MQQIEVTDEWLYQYMPIVDEAIIRELEESTDYEYRFSAKFERKMRRLIWKEAHPQASAVYRQIKRMAALGACAAAVLCLYTMSVEGNRVKFFETVRTMWEDSELYTYFSDGEEGEFQSREPGYLPEGYVETERYLLDTSFVVIYENKIGEMITWEQLLILDGDSVVVDTEYDSRTIYEVDGKIVTVYSYSSGYKYAYCEKDAYVYMLTADSMEIDDIKKVFKFGNKCNK